MDAHNTKEGLLNQRRFPRCCSSILSAATDSSPITLTCWEIQLLLVQSLAVSFGGTPADPSSKVDATMSCMYKVGPLVNQNISMVAVLLQ